MDYPGLLIILAVAAPFIIMWLACVVEDSQRNTQPEDKEQDNG